MAAGGNRPGGVAEVVMRGPKGLVSLLARSAFSCL